MAMWLGRVTNLSTYVARRRPRSITFGRRRKAGRMANAIPVLVVDDDAVSSAQLGALAKAAGYDVKSAYDGREAWELLQLARIPIVISDWYMRSEEHTSELQSQSNLVCRLLLEKKKTI